MFSIEGFTEVLYNYWIISTLVFSLVALIGIATITGAIYSGVAIIVSAIRKPHRVDKEWIVWFFGCIIGSGIIIPIIKFVMPIARNNLF